MSLVRRAKQIAVLDDANNISGLFGKKESVQFGVDIPTLFKFTGIGKERISQDVTGIMVN